MAGSRPPGTEQLTMVCSFCGLTMEELGKNGRPPVGHVHEMVPVVDLQAFRRRFSLTARLPPGKLGSKQGG